MFENEDQELATEEIAFLFSASAVTLLKSADPGHYLDWIAKTGPLLAPGIKAQVDPRTGSIDQFFRALGVNIYNMTPLPDYGLTLQPLPKPSRNDPCYCGSGRKFKQCCITLYDLPLLADYNMLKHVLDHYPLKALANLPETRVDTEALADVAIQWLNNGDERRALALLEPWFKPRVPLTRRQRPLFDLLMDIYLDLDKPRKRKQLLERGCNAEDKPLRADALQRKATIKMDEGDTAAAWEAFGQAQRINPDSPALSLLEISLLTGEDKIAQAKARATFYLKRARRQGDYHPELLDLLEQCTQDPVAALEACMPPSPMDIALAALIQFCEEEAPEPSALYTQKVFGSEVMLVPVDELLGLEAAWGELTDAWHNASPWDDPAPWLGLLAEQPVLWNSLSVLGDLLSIAAPLPTDDLHSQLMSLLTERGADLLELNVSSIQAPQTLPWGMLENRPALRVLMYLAFDKLYGQEDTAGFIHQAERVIALNPSDNQGVRDSLSTAYLEQGEPEKAIALAEQYPDDMLCTLRVNRILAIYMMGNKGKALVELAKIAQRGSAVFDMLVANSPSQPTLSPYGITPGGKDEAWMYRKENLYLWESCNALTWLKQALPSLPGSNRKK